MMSKEEELFMKLLVDRSPAIFQMAWSRGAFRFRILRSWDVLGTSSWTSIKSIMTILGDPNSSNRNMVSILMNWKVMRPTKSQVSLSFHPKKKLTVSEAKQFLDKPGILGFFRIVAMGLQKKGFVFPMSMGPDFGQLKGGRYAIFSQWLYRWPSSTWKKIEPQRVSTTKKPLNSESMFAPWFSSLFFSCHRVWIRICGFYDLPGLDHSHQGFQCHPFHASVPPCVSVGWSLSSSS